MWHLWWCARRSSEERFTRGKVREGGGKGHERGSRRRGRCVGGCGATVLLQQQRDVRKLLQTRARERDNARDDARNDRSREIYEL